jgi:ParB-like chromosome segregation protein Spo0J
MSTATTWEPLKPHPFSKMFEKQDAEAINTLAENMKRMGFLRNEPIITYEGTILDGNTRQAAAKKAGVEPIYETFIGTEDEALNFVEAKIARRSLNKSQRAVAAAMATKLRGKIKRLEESHSANGKPITQHEAAKKHKVSRRLVQQAAEILESATEEEVEELKSGKKTVGQVAKKRGPKPKKQIKKPTMKTEGLKDALGNDVPELLRDLFGDTWLSNLSNQVDVWVAQIGDSKIASDLEKRTKDFAAYANGSMLRVTYAKALDYLINVQKMLAAALPHCVCPSCQGAKCVDCKHSGWMPKWRKEEIDQRNGTSK